jgi:hypothetical protein
MQTNSLAFLTGNASITSQQGSAEDLFAGVVPTSPFFFGRAQCPAPHNILISPDTLVAAFICSYKSFVILFSIFVRPWISHISQRQWISFAATNSPSFRQRTMELFL